VVCDINLYNRGGNEVVTKCMDVSFITKLLITALLLGQAVCHTFGWTHFPGTTSQSDQCHNS